MSKWDALKREEQFGMIVKIFNKLEVQEQRITALEDILMDKHKC
jgi:hypothetical protein